VKLFRDDLSPEEQAFRRWARANYKVFEPVQGVWHPLVQQECVEMNREASGNLKDIS
jgi:hypothetical protein